MPTSQYDQIGKIINVILFLRPKKVLEIGPGFGKYGVLLREYLEYWGTGKEKTYKDWNVQIDAIEAFPNYITPIHRFVYSTIYTGEAQKIVPTLRDTYDLVLLIDVLEHFPKKEGETLLRMLLEKHRSVLISVPRDIGDQKDSFGNPYETHRSSWSLRELKRFAPSLHIRDPLSIIILLSHDRDLIRRVSHSIRYRSLAIQLSYSPLLSRMGKSIKAVFTREGKH